MNCEMRKLALFLLAGVFWGASAAAQDSTKSAEDAAKSAEDAADRAVEAAEKAETAAKARLTSGDDFKGDRLTLRTTVYGVALFRDHSQKDGIAPAGTRLRVIDDSAGQLIVAIEDIPCVIKKARDQSPVVANPFLKLGAASEVDCSQIEIGKLVRPGEAYRIAKDTLVSHGYRRSGWVYGALLVPYKYHRHDKSFSSAATIGPYVGYRLDGLGFDSALIGSVGMASLSVRNGSGGTSTLQGYTAAIGIIASITKNRNPLQIGAMLGRDWAGSNSPIPYEHEGKTWLAVQIGYSFSE